MLFLGKILLRLLKIFSFFKLKDLLIYFNKILLLWGLHLLPEYCDLTLEATKVITSNVYQIVQLMDTK